MREPYYTFCNKIQQSERLLRIITVKPSYLTLDGLALDELQTVQAHSMLWSVLPLTPSNDLIFYLDICRKSAEDSKLDDDSDDNSDDERYDVDKDPFRDYFTLYLAIAREDQFNFVERRAPDGAIRPAVEVCPLYFEVTDGKPDDVFVAITVSLKLKRQTGPREVKPGGDMGHWLEINSLSVTKHLRQNSVMTTLMTNIFQVLYKVCGDMCVYTDPYHMASSLLLCTTEKERAAVKAEFSNWGGFTKSDNTLAVPKCLWVNGLL